MKKLLLLVILMNVIGCGAQDPLERGEPSIPVNDLNKDTDNPPTTFSEESFNNVLAPILDSKCAMCHQAGAPGPRGGFKEAVRLSVFGKPEESELYLRPLGKAHPPIITAQSDEAGAIANWINGQ